MEKRVPKNIVERFKKGDEKAMEYIYDSYFCGLCSYAATFCDDDSVAADQVQEAFVALWCKREMFESEVHIRSFLYRAIRNNILNYNKHQQIVNRNVDDLTYEILSEHEISESIITTEVARQLSESLEALPTVCRRVLSMSIEGHSYKEIGKMLNIAVSTVRNHRMAAIKKLKAHFLKIS